MVPVVSRVDTIWGVMQMVFAHGSGIDDVLWFLVPVIVALYVLRRAEKRAAKSRAETESVDNGAPARPDR